jgi:hypothetical protein
VLVIFVISILGGDTVSATREVRRPTGRPTVRAASATSSGTCWPADGRFGIEQVAEQGDTREKFVQHTEPFRLPVGDENVDPRPS